MGSIALKSSVEGLAINLTKKKEKAVTKKNPLLEGSIKTSPKLLHRKD